MIGDGILCNACFSRRALLQGAALLPFAAPALAAKPDTKGLIEPHMRITGAGADGPRVALTFDACDGHTDRRVLDMLLAENIPATIFASGKWLRGNAAVFKELLAHPELFEIGDHGAHHFAPIDRPETIWGVRAAGSGQGVTTEVSEGARLLEAAGAPRPGWFRGATALYTDKAMQIITDLGYRIAGFSINADQGASLRAEGTARRYHGASDGDVLISHINQPNRAAGAGVVRGVLALKARGVRFVKLSDPTLTIAPIG